jgi:thiol-disulfide isomerase/thioredoxin
MSSRQCFAQTLIVVALCGGCSAAALAQPTDPKPAAPAGGKPASMPAIGMGGGMKAAKPKKDATPLQITGDGKAEATLKLDLRKYDFAGTKSENRMYMPSGAKLSATKPEGLTKEPKYNGTPKYAVITMGNGTPNKFIVALDEATGKEPQIFLDLNGDGDLTNDGTGAWEKKIDGKEGAAANYQGTWAFKPGYKTADGGNTVGQYALNFYWQPGRESLNYYNASARVGKISIGGKDFDVTLIENDGDGLYNKLYDSSKPIIVGEPMSKPVWLLLDGDQVDIRGTFPFGDMNYLATVSDDGSTLSLAPTMKVVRVPRPTERPAVLPAGGPAPDFEAIAWKSGAEKIDTTSRFKLSDFKGKKIVVLDMWATWCGPCMKGIPHMSKIAEAVKGQDVVVIALNSYDDEAPFVKFASGKGKDYHFMLARDPAGRDSDHTIAKSLFHVTAIPATYIIDKTGKIVEVISGYSEGDSKVEQVLKGLGVKFE